jgi:threonine/homoserine/homoserine lactone efflux protein
MKFTKIMFWVLGLVYIGLGIFAGSGVKIKEGDSQIVQSKKIQNWNSVTTGLIFIMLGIFVHTLDQEWE